MTCASHKPELLLGGSLFSRSARLTVSHEPEVSFLNHVVPSEFLGGESPVLNHRLHSLRRDSQTRGDIFSSKQIHASLIGRNQLPVKNYIY